MAEPEATEEVYAVAKNELSEEDFESSEDDKQKETESTVKPEVTEAPEENNVTNTESPEVTETPEATKQPEPEATEQPVPEDKPSEDNTPGLSMNITEYERYHAMSGAEQKQVVDSFSSMEAFFNWYNKAKAEYDALHPEVGMGDLEIDLSGGVSNN